MLTLLLGISIRVIVGSREFQMVGIGVLYFMALVFDVLLLFYLIERLL